MNRIIHLADCAHLPCNGDGYKPESMATARATQAKRNLRWDNATGIMRDKDGELERFSNPADHTPHTSLDDVMQWEFSRYLRNSASRIERGYEP